MSFPKINPKQSFPKLEEEILAFWEKEKIFEKSLAQNSPEGEFKFFDGPPFATGLPHYGHILQGVIKDLIPRYKTMRGFKVPRVWGWDCHGLPVENLIEKDLELKSKQDVEKFGVGKFNEKCRESVLKYAEEWQKTVQRMGRWIEMKNAYKTMDLEYMNSVWWVFGELWKKGLIYEGLKPMHICPRCETPLSNFEVGLGYKEITDLSATVKFKIKKPRILFITGPASSGKTTLSKLIATTNNYELISWDDIANNLEKIAYESKKYLSPDAKFLKTAILIIESTRDLIKKGKNVLIEGGLVEEYLDIYRQAFENDGNDLEIKVLLPTKDSILVREKGRNDERSKMDKDHTDEFLPRFQSLVKKLGNSSLIDNTNLTPKETAEKFFNYNTYLLAWTTTPWTLPGNVALAVNPEVDYIKVKVNKYKREKNIFIGPPMTSHGGVPIESIEPAEKIGEEIYIISREFFKNNRTFEFYLEENKFEKIHGSELVGKTYKPLFDYFVDKKSEGAFRIVAADFVTTDDGTGIVHIAPAFGEDDYEIAKKENLPIIQHVSMDGKFTEEVGEFAGMEVKPAKNPRETDEKIVKWLETNDKLFEKKNYKHSYPHCWRCDTPLLNYATSSWFVAVEKIKKDLLAGNEKINWVPAHIREGRFGKWLEGARDWAISRNRFWGAPLPIWRCEKCGKTVCVKSKEELEKLSGENVKDLHKHFVDKISWQCECGGEMRRIPEVLDCWFESGSMPFAQFGEKESAQIPASFIAEAQDQTRGWFYTLHVLATALKNKPAFSNCVCSGLVLAEDGEKMSKSKQNFPPPQEIFDKYGADAMRLYLMQSQVTHAEDLRFSERGVEETLRSVLLPLWNTFYFFTTYANADGWKNSELPTKLSNPLDRWILSELNLLIREMTDALEKYEIQKAVAPLAKFLDGLTNWYIRRSRRRFWKSENDGDKNEAYATLFEVLKTVSKLLAPVCPFLAEKIYKDLTGGESVHLEKWSNVDKSKIDENLSKEVETTRKIISLGLKIRATEKIKVRQPLQSIKINYGESLKISEKQKNIILEELNIKNMEIIGDPTDLAKPSSILSYKILGSKFKDRMQKAIAEAKKGKMKNVDGGWVLPGMEDIIIKENEFSVRWIPKPKFENFTIAAEESVIILLDTKITPELELEGKARDLVRVIQDLRKKAGYEVSDRIELQLEGADEILEKWEKYIATETLAKKVSRNLDSPDAKDSLENIKIGVKKITK